MPAKLSVEIKRLSPRQKQIFLAELLKEKGMRAVKKASPKRKSPKRKSPKRKSPARRKYTRGAISVTK